MDLPRNSFLLNEENLLLRNAIFVLYRKCGKKIVGADMDSFIGIVDQDRTVTKFPPFSTRQLCFVICVTGQKQHILMFCNLPGMRVVLVGTAAIFNTAKPLH